MLGLQANTQRKGALYSQIIAQLPRLFANHLNSELVYKMPEPGQTATLKLMPEFSHGLYAHNCMLRVDPQRPRMQCGASR